MKSIINPIATTVFGNELAYTYMEVNQPSAVPGKGTRRYRIIVVKRDDRLAEYREDMGKASDFKGIKQLNIPSLWEHSVDYLKDLANELRNEKGIDVAQLIRTNNFKLV